MRWTIADAIAAWSKAGRFVPDAAFTTTKRAPPAVSWRYQKSSLASIQCGTTTTFLTSESADGRSSASACA